MSATAERLDHVDSLRGFALGGVFAANLLIFSGINFMTDAQREALATAKSDAIFFLLERVLVENKFLGLFGCLFGVSFWLFLDRVRARGAGGVGLFYSRIGWLFVFGCVHGWLFWCFDILRFYALWGLLLPLFLRVSTRVLLGAALFFAILAPALITGMRALWFPQSDDGSATDALALTTFSSGGYGEMLRANWKYDWYLTDSIGQAAYQIAIFGRLLLGLCAARAGVLIDLERFRPLFRALLPWAGIVGLAGNVADATHLLDAHGDSGFFTPFAKELATQLGHLSLTVAYASAVLLLFMRPLARQILRLLSPIGRMALTFYLLQTLIGLWLFYGFMPGPHLMGKIGATWISLIWAIGYAFQIVLADHWLQRFRFGPAEWVWRALTYRKRPPMLRVSVLD